MKLSEAQGILCAKEFKSMSRVEICMLHIELLVTSHSIKLSLRLARLNTDGAAFYHFTYL